MWSYMSAVTLESQSLGGLLFHHDIFRTNSSARTSRGAKLNPMTSNATFIANITDWRRSRLLVVQKRRLLLRSCATSRRSDGNRGRRRTSYSTNGNIGNGDSRRSRTSWSRYWRSGSIVLWPISETLLRLTQCQGRRLLLPLLIRSFKHGFDAFFFRSAGNGFRHDRLRWFCRCSNRCR